MVLVKEVAELEDDFEMAGDRIDEKYFEYDLNQFDEYAVEEAVQLKEESEHDVEVVAATIGPERSEETIRMALAKEVDRAVRVWDESLEGHNFLDTPTKTAILSEIVEEEDPELIVSGAQADDDLFSTTGVSLAETIDYQWAAVVIDLQKFDPDDQTLKLHRELEGGVEEKTEIDLPAVLTIQSGINEPRYASLRGIRQAQKKPLDVKSLADIGLDESILDTPVELVDMHEPESETDTEILEGDASEQAQNLAELLKDKGVAE